MEQIFAFLPGVFSRLLDVPINDNPRLVINVVAFFLIVFIAFYIRPSWLARRSLMRAVKDLLKKKSEKTVGTIVTKDELERVFSHSFFSSAWTSYRDTLHEQYEYQYGQRQLMRIRSTVPAEALFSPQSLVDSRLNVEFFKHLPGILTGIGIIGTFYGLIHGIQQFDPSLLAKAKADPVQMEKLFAGLKVLFEEVQGAFIASFFAIGVAMLITFFEKFLLNICYRQLEELCRELDNLYEGGVGEDYLASLVKSSEESSTQTKQLKESLVTELSELLRELTAKQVKQTEVLGELLSAKIQEHIDSGEKHNESLSSTLKSGLEIIGDKVAHITSGQSDTMTGMLEHLIQTFSANIQNTVGDQMKGLAILMNTTVASMTEMQNGFKDLLQDLRQSGKTEREDLTAKVISLINTLEAQQGKLEIQMTAFIETIQKQIGENQQETMLQVRENLREIQGSVDKILKDMEKERMETVVLERERQQDFVNASKRLVTEMGTQVGSLVERNQQIVESLGEKVSAKLNESLTITHVAMGKLLADMEQDRKFAANMEREQHQAFTNTSRQLVEDMQSQLGDLIEHISKTVAVMNESIAGLSQTSITAIDKMNNGALRIEVATNNFVEAGNKVSGVMTQSERVSNSLSQSAGQLAQASGSLEGMLNQYAATRDVIASMVGEINSLLERAKQEAGVNQKIVDDMRRMVESFGILKDDMDDFVENVSKLLAETLTKFRSDMTTHNAEFHKHHADTLKQVVSAYQPLADAIGGLSDMMARASED
jgi:putative membrane protein